MRDSLKDILAGKQVEEPSLEDHDTPEQVQNLGPCVSRATTKWWPGFHLKNATVIEKGAEPRKTTRSFDYSHMGYREFLPNGTEFVVEIQEPEKWRIRVEGLALWLIYNMLHQHRLEWLEPAVGRSAMAVPSGTPVIERITIQRIEDAE